MTSSWAGAFGQTQFEPSTFFAHAVDGDGDGKRDLWHSIPDALSSTADLLADAGWKRDAPWGYEVKLPTGFAFEDCDIALDKPVSEWRKQGVKTVSGDPLPASDANGAIYLPAGAHGPAFLVFGNFKAILKYNNAASYALAVAELADSMTGASGIAGAWPLGEQPLTREGRFAFQTYLARLGYDVGPIDGIIGHQAKAALRDWQKAHDLPADGFATQNVLGSLYADLRAKGK